MYRRDKGVAPPRESVSVSVVGDGITILISPNAKRWLYRLFAVYATVVAIFFSIVYLSKYNQVHSRKKNVIMMVSDGFGPASQTMARNYYAHIHDFDESAVLPLDTILVGSSRTRSSSSLVTDSAAGATAFACSLKTYNGAIGVDPQQQPCGTVLEAAKAKGYKTGLVVTSRITHATPASFSAHVTHRDMENQIAMQQIGNYTLGRNLDLMFGGGRCQFLPRTDLGSCRADDIDLIDAAIKTFGWNYLDTVTQFRSLDAANAPLPLMGLFSLDHMAYNIDRDPSQEPALLEMSIKALEILSHATTDSENGFFMMIEGSRIDMAAHSNDPAAHVREILHYNRVVEAVKDWVAAHPDTVMISTSDHETGGVSVAHQMSSSYPTYKWTPEALVHVRNSSEAIGDALADYSGPIEFASFIRTVVIPNWLGIANATDEEVAYLSEKGRLASSYSDYVSKMISDRAELGWATHGHSAVDVNLYAFGLNSHKLRGNHENTDIGKFIVDLLDLDLDDITGKLRGLDLSATTTEGVKGAFRERHYHHL